MTGGRDLLRRSRGGMADTARLRWAAIRRKGSSPFGSTSCSDQFQVVQRYARKVAMRMAADHETWVRIPHVPPVNSGPAGFISSRQSWVLARNSHDHSLARLLYSPDQRAHRRVPAWARLGPPRDITDFASAPVGVARRIPV